MQREKLVKAKCKGHWAVSTEEGTGSLRKQGQGKGQSVQAQCSQGSSRSLGVGSGYQGIADADTRYKKAFRLLLCDSDCVWMMSRDIMKDLKQAWRQCVKAAQPNQREKFDECKMFAIVWAF
jgi:hypothetical protein